MKKQMTVVIAMIMTLAMSITSFAAGWQRNEYGWWWQNTDGSWPANCWQWLDGNRDGVAECYYFNEQGYLLVNTITPDGYWVNGNGAWTVNNVVQTRRVNTGSISPSPRTSYSNQRRDTNNTSRDGWYGSGSRMKYRQNGKYLKNTWKTIDGDKYYFDSNGYALTGFHTIGNKTYYFNNDGTLQRSSFSSNGYSYVVPNRNGVIEDVVDEDDLADWEFYSDLLAEFY